MSSQVQTFLSKFFHSQKDINNILKYSSSKINILTWLFEMEYEERIKTFSLVNYDICLIIIKMYDKFNASNKIKFKINLKDKKPIINHKDFASDYYSLSDNYKFIQKLLLENLRFYKIYKTNDAVTLSSDLLMNPQLFCDVFDKLSNNNFLSELCPVVLDSKQGVYTSASPKWIEESEYYNISQIIIGYFENLLNIKYTLSKRKKNDINDVFKNFFNKKKVVLDLINQSNHTESLFNMIDLKGIISDVVNDKILINDEERRLTSKKFLLGIYKPFKMFEPPTEYNQNNIFYKYKELLMEKSESMLNKLIFFPFEGENAIDRHIKEKIFDALYSYAEKKKIENVLLEITEDGFLSNNNNNKKKLKKKKKKNKKNENENNKQNIFEENKSNNIDNEKDITNNENNINKLNIIINESNKLNSNNTQESEDIKEKISKIKEENNENNISTISNSSNNNNKDFVINNNENLENNNNITNELNEEKNNNIIINNINSINIYSEKNSIKSINEKENNNHIIFGKKGISENKNDNINKINITSDEEEENEDKKENETKEEIKKDNNLSNNILNNKRKKKRKKKPKKKLYKLTPEELNNIYSNFYNENNYFIKKTQNKLSNSVIPIQLTNKNTGKEKNDQLHNLILGFEKKIYKKILSLHEIKYNSIVLLCQKIKNHFKCGLSIFIYGSYSTGLELEESDIDISVELIPNNNTNNNIINNNTNNNNKNNNLSQKTTQELISELNEYLSNFPEFKNLFPIVNTKIPILKMKIVLENNIETKIDLTFNLKNTTNTINYYNNTLKRYPQIRPLTLLIKYLIKKNKLASVFDGGFSSHSIFIMVASNIRVLLKNKSSLNLGDLLNGFLHFYGKVFNYTNTTIDLMNKNNPYIINQEFSKVPIFIDPISKVNVSKSSFLHEELKKLLSDTYDKLVTGEENLNKTFEDIFF